MSKSILQNAIDRYGWRAIHSRLTPEQRVELRYNWKLLGRPEQQLPKGKWRNWMFLAGRGGGKTRSASEAIRYLVESGKIRNIALIAETAADARDTMVELGDSSIMKTARPNFMPKYEPSKRRLTWPNGAVATTYSADKPGQLRGPQHDFAWCLIPGTMIRTPDGSRPIEDLVPGDLVMTRKGPRPILAVGSRQAQLWTVGPLRGSGEHPIMTQRGWVPLSEVAADDSVYTWCDDGKQTLADTCTATSPQASSTNTEPSGKSTTGLFQRVATSTTGMVDAVTTRLRTWSSSLRRLIHNTTVPSESFASASPASKCLLDQQVADLRCAASAAGESVLSNNAGPSNGPAPASSVGSCSSETAHTFVSVGSAASTSGLVGTVHSLKVDDAPEFFANDVLTHNCDEMAKWRYPDDTWSNLQFGLRLVGPKGMQPKAMITTTPRPTKLVLKLAKGTRNLDGTYTPRPGSVVTHCHTYDNSANLADDFLEEMRTEYEGSRLGRQELAAEILDEIEGALWTIGLIDEHRIGTEPERMSKLIVAVDPPAKSHETSDAPAECGIVAVGKEKDHYYPLLDRSCFGKPVEWAREAIRTYHELKADCIVVETNQGGDMVKHTLQSVDSSVPIKTVHASRGKVTRAEPVATLYEQGRVHHVGVFPKLEDQLSTWVPGEDSPDRLDALVWGVSYLRGKLPGREIVGPSTIALSGT